MTEQEAFNKLKARMGEWQSYVDQTPAPRMQAAEEAKAEPDLFDWNGASDGPAPAAPPVAASAYASTPNAAVPSVAVPSAPAPEVKPDKTLVARLIRYETQIAELQAALERDRAQGISPAALAVQEAAIANLSAELESEPRLALATNEAGYTPEGNVPAGMKPNLTPEEAKANQLLWMLVGVVILGICSLLAILALH